MSDLSIVGTLHKRCRESVPCFRDSTASANSNIGVSDGGQPSEILNNVVEVPCLSVSTRRSISTIAVSSNSALGSMPSENASQSGDLEVPATTGATKRFASNSVLDCVIETCNDEVDSVIMQTGATAEHVEDMGNNGLDVSASASARLDALRERVLARMIGKQRRLDAG